MLGLTQEGLAYGLGDDWNPKRVLLLEGKEEIEPALLEQVAKALKVPGEAIKNFTEEAAYNIIGNTVTNNENVAFFQYNPSFNPIDKVVELYERMLKEKDDTIEKFKNLLKGSQ